GSRPSSTRSPRGPRRCRRRRTGCTSTTSPARTGRARSRFRPGAAPASRRRWAGWSRRSSARSRAPSRARSTSDADASSHGFAVQQTLAGVVSVPLVDGKPLSREEFERLPEDERQRITRGSVELEERVAGFLHQLRALQTEQAERVQSLDRDIALFAVRPLFRELEDAYREQPAVLGFLAEVKEDVLAHVPELRNGAEPELPLGLLGGRRHELAQYRVNVLVENAAR